MDRRVTLRLAKAPYGLAEGGTPHARRRMVLAAIARREWLLRTLALATLGCRGRIDRAIAGTVTVAIDGGEKDMSPTIDRNSKFLVFLH